MEHTPGPWKPDGKHMLITQLVEGHPTRKRFYGIEGKVGNYRDTIAYFTNEADRDLCLVLLNLLTTCEEFLDVWEFEHSPDEGASIEYRDYLKDVFGVAVEGIEAAIARACGECA